MGIGVYGSRGFVLSIHLIMGTLWEDYLVLDGCGGREWRGWQRTSSMLSLVFLSMSVSIPHISDLVYFIVSMIWCSIWCWWVYIHSGMMLLSLSLSMLMTMEGWMTMNMRRVPSSVSYSGERNTHLLWVYNFRCLVYNITTSAICEGVFVWVYFIASSRRLNRRNVWNVLSLIWNVCGLVWIGVDWCGIWFYEIVYYLFQFYEIWIMEWNM